MGIQSSQILKKKLFFSQKYQKSKIKNQKNKSISTTGTRNFATARHSASIQSSQIKKKSFFFFSKIKKIKNQKNKSISTTGTRNFSASGHSASIQSSQIKKTSFFLKNIKNQKSKK